MKNISFTYYLLLITLAFNMLSCSDQELLTEDEILNKSECITDEQGNCINGPFLPPASNYINDVGQEHNNGLALIFDNVIENGNFQSSFELNNAVSQEGWNFISGFSDVNSSNESIIEDIFMDHYFGNDDTVISVGLQNELNILVSYLDNTITEFNDDAGQDVYNYSLSIINSPPSHLSNTDKEAWKYAVSVMGHSAQYWSVEYVEWESEIQFAKAGFWRRLWSKIKDVVIADAKGAATGAVAGLINTGTLEGAAIGAAAGGLGASAGKAVEQIF